MDPQPPRLGSNGSEPPRHEPRVGGVLLVGVVALAAGLLGYVVGATATGDDSEASSPSSLTAPPTSQTSSTEPATSVPPPTSGTTTSAPGPALLSELVPGLADTVVLVTGGQSGNMLLEWRSDRRAPAITPLPAGVSPVSDTTGRLLAGRGFAADHSLEWVMYVGPADALWPAAVGVTSLAWHNTIAGRLAWLEKSLEKSEEDVRLLRVGEIDPEDGFTPGAVVTQVPVGHALLAWDSWGFVIGGDDRATDASVVYLVDHDGAEQWRVPAQSAVASYANQLLLIGTRETTGTDYALGSPGSLAEEDPDPAAWAPAAGGGAESVAWSPDTTHLAFQSWQSGSRYWRIEVWGRDGVAVGTVDVPYRLWDVAWSRDGRFVLAPGTDNAGKFVVVFYDTMDGSLDEVEFDTWVLTLFSR